MEKLKIDFRPNYKYEDYIQWEGKWELIDGIPYAMSPSPIFVHQVISGNIAFQLEELLKNCGKCISLFGLDWHVKGEKDNNVVCPDNLVICKEVKGKFIEDAPAMIFEIISPSTEDIDRLIKYNLYQKEKVKYYIIVDIKRESAEVYRITDGKYSKIEDTKKSIVNFDLGECKIEFDFSKIWKIKK